MMCPPQTVIKQSVGAHELLQREELHMDIKKMIEENAYCIDVLNQVSAVSSAIGSFSKELLNEHIRTCVADDIIKGNTEKIDELSDIFKKFIK